MATAAPLWSPSTGSENRGEPVGPGLLDRRPLVVAADGDVDHAGRGFGAGVLRDRDLDARACRGLTGGEIDSGGDRRRRDRDHGRGENARHVILGCTTAELGITQP